MDVPSIENEPKPPTNTQQIVRTGQNKQNSPDSAAKQTLDEPNSCGSHTNALSARMHSHSAENDARMAANVTENVRMHQNDSKMQNSPNAHGFATPELASRWRQVGVGDVSVYVPWNPPIEVLKPASQNIVFGRIESGGEAKATNVEGAGAVDGNSDRFGDDGDSDDMESGGSVDSQGVKGVQLSIESAHAPTPNIARKLTYVVKAIHQQRIPSIRRSQTSTAMRKNQSRS